MVGGRYKPPRWVLSLRWIARIWSVGSISLILGFVVGEGLHPSGYEWLGLLFFPLGISVGMVIAWWKEGLGGGITVGSLVAFYLVHIAAVGTFPRGWAWLAFAAPGFLSLLVSLVSQRPRV